VLILSVLGFNTESQETFQCPVLACHAKIFLQLNVHQLLLFSIEMLMCLENTLFLLIMYCIGSCIHNILCDPCRWFSQGSVVSRASDLLWAGWSGVERGRDFLHLSRTAALRTSYSGHRVSFLGVKRGVDAHHHLVPKLKKE